MHRSVYVFDISTLLHSSFETESEREKGARTDTAQ